MQIKQLGQFQLHQLIKYQLDDLQRFPKNEDFEAINKYIDSRKKQEYEKIISGENKEIEKRYDRYVDYG